jgi:NAD(P)-dependent dehydrogenase (short-subunit alcohol dehydrogenase family)
MKLEGKVALITGAGSGIGRAQALALSREGAKIAIADINQEGIDESIRLISSHSVTAKGLNINAIAPGSVATPMIKKSLESDPDGYSKRVLKIPEGRLGEPEDIARATVFLASDDSDFVNGHILSVDGGRNALG